MLRTSIATLVIAVLAAACSSSPAAAPASALASPSATAPAPPATARPTVAPATQTPAPSPADLSLVVVGDSIPYGRRDCNECVPFPTLFGSAIEANTGLSVKAQNLSQHDGLTAARMAVELPASASVKEALAGADIIVISIGHNDTPWNALDDTCDGDKGFFDGNASASWEALVGPCLKVEVKRFRKNLATILAEIRTLRGDKPTAIRLLTQYADIPGDRCCPPEATGVSTTIKDAFNKAACDVASDHDVVCVDVYHAFNGPDGSGDPGPLLAPDHTHPSAKGHEVIAGLLMDAGLAPLQ
jgi:lysophospholipase L1-like esterase